jgi:hypothetical protein
MPVYQLGNGNDYFNSDTKADWTNDSAVFGGNGDDTIVATAVFPYSDTPIFVDGGNGSDFIQLQYASHGVAFGGNGDDTLLTTGGLGNTLIGGNGDDTLTSVGGGSGMQPGNTLTGGLGRDTFTLVNDGNLVVTNDAAGDGVVSDGDTFKGPMDAITDYQRGEHIGLRQYDSSANGPAAADVPLARIDGVTLAPDPYSQDYLRPEVGSAQYAVFHGTFAGGNTFTVGADGPDLLAVYDTRTGPTELVGKGSLVLLGVTDETLLDQALSPSTAQGPGGWGDYGGGLPGGADAQSAALSAVLDRPADSVGALGVTPA